MNTIFLRKGVSLLSTLAALAILGDSLSAAAQTVDTPSQPSVNVVSPSDSTSLQQFSQTATPESASRILTPIPGTAATVSAALTPKNSEPTVQQPNSQPSTPKVAQADIDPGRATRGGKSYLGLGGNIGLSGGDSSLSDGNFAVISKVGLTNNISVRPSAIIGDSTVILAPLTYDFSFQQVADPFSEPLPVAPYIGAGAAFKIGDDSDVAVLVTGGIDVPLNSRFTATAAVNAAFFGQTDVGLLLGVGYNFGSY
ncbi:hypothetical protein [Calothrix sp. PCC 7507]|uniref:hypothetical protein n=1 Tax=Calothrix sp. PCC 7507 TaxID=99598 RepID=UPI00029F011B|nr:hypothetical protein [Calothrix sp. PCC 7507]AFY34028.1 hypothetical protein Cal7507_3636 [Calothrix sp. PCC 7507]